MELEGAIYHVMNRGDRGEDIFVGDADRHLFLELLGQACAKTGWKIHAYVLMGNHYHLMIETPQANLVAGMKWLQNTYTIRFNRGHRLSGHLFQGRYKAVLVAMPQSTEWGCIDLTDSGRRVKTRGSPHENTDKKAGSRKSHLH